jgi:hypothetical protein
MVRNWITANEVKIVVQVTNVFETRPEEVLETPPDHLGCTSVRGPEGP